MMPFFDLLQEILKSNNKKKGRQRLLERFFDLRKKKTNTANRPNLRR